MCTLDYFVFSSTQDKYFTIALEKGVMFIHSNFIEIPATDNVKRFPVRNLLLFSAYCSLTLTITQPDDTGDEIQLFNHILLLLPTFRQTTWSKSTFSQERGIFSSALTIKKWPKGKLRSAMANLKNSMLVVRLKT